MLRYSLLACFVLALAAPAAADENQIWTSFDFKTKLAKESKFEFGLNTELRYQPDGDLDTIELRPGIGYELDNGLKISAGYLYSSTRRSGPDRREHRLWQQVAYDITEAGGGELTGRSRFEERQREGADGTGWRLRQQFAYERPIKGTKLKLALSNEAMLGFNTTSWGHAKGLQENRAKATVKWKAAGVGWEAGYLNQYRNGVNGAKDQHNDHLFLGLSASF